jgi:hypothetical protein
LDVGSRAQTLGRALLKGDTDKLGRLFLVWSAFAAALALCALPVFSTRLPPVFDYPNHLARMHLLLSGGNRFYAVRWAPLPNLAEDLFVPPLARLMPLEFAAKVFLVAIFALSALGALLLNRVSSGAWRLWPLLAFLLLYSRIFLWGFLNYLFGVGLALCSAALWLVFEKKSAGARIVVSALAALLIYLSHIAAFGFYALLILGLELPPAFAALKARDGDALVRRLAVAGVQFIAPLGLLLSWQAGAEGPLRYPPFWRKADLLFTLFDNYDRPFDIASFVLFLGLLLWLAARRRLGLSPRLAVAAALSFAAYLALPSGIAGGSGLDHRLVPAFFLFLVGASAPSFPSRRIALAIGAGAALLFAVRISLIEHVWLQADSVYRAPLQAIDRLPRERKLALAYPPRAVDFAAIPEFHLATLAIARREDFVPSLFANPAQQPVVLTAEGATLAAMAPPGLLWSAFVAGQRAPAATLSALLTHYDFLVFVDNRAFRVPPSRCLRPFFRQRRFQMFAIGSHCRPAAGRS